MSSATRQPETLPPPTRPWPAPNAEIPAAHAQRPYAMTASPTDPIAAIATPPGRGGIGIVRVSGPALADYAHDLLGLRPRPRHAHYLELKTDAGEVIDQGIALFFPGPASYTGEDVLEWQGHGGVAVLRQVLDRCLQAGAASGMRLAEPGEFTRRAFLNGRVDLAQAEAVADLIDASSGAAARAAVASLSGVFSQEVNALAARILHLRVLVEATLDFPEEEIEFLEKYQARETLTSLSAQLAALRAQAHQGNLLREGLHVVLAGLPNAGKSSLLNALAGDEVAIVTPVAGTTRDKVTHTVYFDGVPVHIVDTAGLRETDDPVERIGIERAWKEIERADAIVHLQDAAQPDSPLDAAIVARLPAHTPRLQIYNKIDVAPAPVTIDGEHTLAISAKRGDGLPELRQRLLQLAGWNPAAESPWLARERHTRALAQAAHHLDLAIEHAKHDDRVLDLFAEELRLAHDALGSITGVVKSDDLLGEIFSSFCIGK